jgi:WD40 repeat protein/transcriptional regulator with XRE-family HTH domain
VPTSPGDQSGSGAGPSAVDLSAVRAARDLAGALTELRLTAGLSVREVSKRCGIPASTLGGYFGGGHLPPATRPEVLRDLLTALGVPPADQGAWQATVRRLSTRREGGGPREPSPYPGLASFDGASAADFHGRDTLVDQLRTEVGSGAPGDSRIVVVTGASGSGKSSLIAAGLLPRLESWSTARCTPGRSPAESFAAAVAMLGTGPGPECLVIDQLEELWTLGTSPMAAAQALETVAGWVAQGRGSARVVVLGLRADYYGAASEIAALLPALRDHQVVVGPMSPEELAAAIALPATSLEVAIEPGLVDILVRECLSSSQAGLASALPHLSHCLATMWNRTAGDQLTLATYLEVGGIAGAIGRTAEEAFTALEPVDARRARHLLLRLVSVEEGVRPSAATLDLDDLSEDDRRLVNHFAERRLLTVDTSTVRLGHEALIESWPRLSQWIEESQAVLLQRRSISRDARAWQAADREEDLLLRGTRLAALREWSAEELSTLDQRERAFVEASAALADRIARGRRRQQRRLRLLLVATSMISVIALVASAGYLTTNRNLARERDEAQSRQVAVVARTIDTTNPPVGHQLAVAAYGFAPTLEARSALLDAASETPVARITGPVGYRQVAVSQSRHLMAVAGMLGTVSIYDISGAPSRIGQVPAPVTSAADSTIFALAFSPDGTKLALGGDGAKVRVLDLSDPTAPAPSTADLDTPGTVYAVAFLDATTLLAATQSGGVRRWDLGSGGATPGPSLPLAGAVQALALGPDGQVAAGTDAGEVAVWRTVPRSEDGAQPAAELSVSPSPISSLAFSSATSLLVGSHDGTLRRLAVAADRIEPDGTVSTFTSWVNAIAVDGDLTAAGSSDGSVRLWRDGASVDLAEHTFSAPVATVAFADSSRLALGLTSGQVDLVDLAGDLTRRGSRGVFAVGFDRTGQRLLLSPGSAQDAQVYSISPPNDPAAAPEPASAAPRIVAAGPAVTIGSTADPLNGPATIAPNGQLVIMARRSGRIVGVDLSDPAHPRPTFDLQVADAMPEQLALDSSGRTLIVAGDDRQVHVLSLASGSAHQTAVLTGATNHIIGAAISPDASLVAAASLDTNVRLWRHGTNGWALAATLPGQGAALTVAFDPTGTRLAAAGSDHRVRIWNISDPQQPRLLATLAGPGNDIYQVAISTAGDVAAASMDKNVTVWRPRTGSSGDDAPIYDTYAVLRSAGVALYSVAWSPDGSRLLAGGGDGIARLWSIEPSTALQQVCTGAGDPVTAAEWSTLLAGLPFERPCQG